VVTVSAVIAIYAYSRTLWDSPDSVLFDWVPFVRDNATCTHTSVGLAT
jgi:hypothetical protein